MGTELSTVDGLKARQNALAVMTKPEDVQGVIVDMKRAEQIAKAADLGEVVHAAGETRLLAQRKLGDLLRECVGLGRPKESVPSDGTLSANGQSERPSDHEERALLEQLGINRNASSRLQRLADYPEDALREYCRQQVDLGAGVPGIQAVLDSLSGRSKHGPDYNNADTKSVEHYTPLEIQKLVKAVFGGRIDLDPCCNPGTPNVKAKRYYTAEDDGLAQPRWTGNVFCNPPYGAGVDAWAKKAREQVDMGWAKAVIMLLAARPGTEAFKALRGSPICFFDDRIAFIGEKNTGKAPFASAAYWVSKEPPDRFVEVFREVGPVYVLHPECEVAS